MMALILQIKKVDFIDAIITKAWNGKECNEKFKVNEFDIVFLDY